MRKLLAGSLLSTALLAPAPSNAAVIRFEGDARIELHEILEHGNWYDLSTTVVEVEIELHGPRGVTFPGPALGAATIRHPDGVETTVPMQGEMYPAEGSAGFAEVRGVGDDGNEYCLRVWDHADAPTPRPDHVVAVMEPLDRYAQGYAGEYMSGVVAGQGVLLMPYGNCYPMERKLAAPLEGDFSFSNAL